MAGTRDISDSALRVLFEEDLLLLSKLKKNPAPNFARHQDAKGGSQHSYKDKKIQQMWCGYKLHHEMRYLIQWTSAEDVERPLGKYVVARLNHIGVPVFSRHPYRHQSFQLALTEANRLGEEHGARFGVFRCIAIDGGKQSVTIGEQIDSINNLSEI